MPSSKPAVYNEADKYTNVTVCSDKI